MPKMRFCETRRSDVTSTYWLILEAARRYNPDLLPNQFLENFDFCCLLYGLAKMAILATKGIYLEKVEFLRIFQKSLLEASRVFLSTKNEFRAQNYPREWFSWHLQKVKNLTIWPWYRIYRENTRKYNFDKNLEKAKFTILWDP